MSLDPNFGSNKAQSLGGNPYWQNPANTGGWMGQNTGLMQGLGTLGGAGLTALGAYIAGNRSGPNPGVLPFTEDLVSGMANMRELISDTQMSRLSPQDLAAVRNAARQESSVRGLDGPLGASMAVDAQTQLTSAFARERAMRLQSLLQQQQQMAAAAQQQEYIRRQQLMASEQASRNNAMGTGGAIGAGIGGAIGSFIPGFGTALGGVLGGGLGTLVGSLF